MSRYIVDTSVIIQHLVNERYTVNANTLLSEAGKSITVFVPEFCLLECTNVLWKHVRFQGVPEEQAKQLVNALAALRVVVTPVIGLLPRALEIGLKHQLAVYDSIYIALAEELGHPLVTDDAHQEAAALAEGVTLKPITDFIP